MTVLAVEGLHKTYDVGVPRRGDPAPFAVDDVSFDVGPGELLTLLGPSGCGKTTTLRSIAGLEDPDRGRITLTDRVLFDSAAGIDLPPNRRGIAMVFQSYAIWPHMTVAGNVAFPLEVRRKDERETSSSIDDRVSRMLQVVGLGGMDGRPATSLSGGQQQRLALARALVMEPPLMLLDEPLSNLDAKLRESMRIELTRLQHEAGVAAVYVTHDQEEALALSNRVAVMNEGRIVQLATPREIYDQPADAFVAGFVGASTMVSGKVVEVAEGFARVESGDVSLWARTRPGVVVGSTVTAMIRPEYVQVDVADVVDSVAANVGEGPVNRWRGEVVTTAFLGASVDRYVRVGNWELRAREAPHAMLARGDALGVSVPATRVHLLPH